MTWTIRTLEEGDMHRFAEIAECMHAESAFSKYPLDIERTIYVILTMAEMDEAYVKGLFLDGLLVGMMIGEVTKHPWVDMRLAVEHAFYILPKHRGGRGAITMVRDFEGWASRQAADRVQISAAARNDNESVSRFLAAAGLPQYGFMHARELT